MTITDWNLWAPGGGPSSTPPTPPPPTGGPVYALTPPGSGFPTPPSYQDTLNNVQNLTGGLAGPSPTVPTSNINAMDTMSNLMPWIAQLGLTNDIRNWIILGYTPEAIVAALRQTPQWQEYFPSIRRGDGTLRMTEGDYLSRVTDYRQVMNEYGRNPNITHKEIASFIENEVDPNELKKRLDVYGEVEKSSQNVKDAFYVYAGMNLSSDDLYAATVDPEKAKQLQSEYDRSVAASPMDYNTWITRATEVGLNRVVSNLERLQEQGIDTGGAIANIQQSSPDFARQMADALYSNGTDYLDLNSLVTSFEMAMIGSAASEAGMGLPTAERINAFRQAGVNRAKAQEQYGSFARKKNWISGAVERSNRANSFTQTDFEDAVFLNSAPAADLMDQALKSEEALGKNSGYSPITQAKGGKIQQTGLSSKF